ncbi:unnamed protein product [Ectocarpus sp. 6 AP-2014]
MGMGAFFLGLAAAPLFLCSAFVPRAGFRSSAFTATAAGGFPASSREGPVLAAERIPLFMSVAGDGDGDHAQHQPDQKEARSSRAQFVGRVSAGVVAATAATAASGLAAGGLGVGTAPVFADSTGKYSSKATARKRYLPRIVKLVKAFQTLKKDIASGSASPKSEFFVDVLADSVSAMDLYGSSMKKGETPDSKSRALQQLAQDFGSTCISIGKSLGKKGGEEEASKAYDKASSILVKYLEGVELDPLGSDVYK